ncbi:recombinase family protein [Rhodococcus zopfii]|uniref:recombinase family protein n=1 Tax=Rhodococcus zopfii TaxID=43772 RepID=UPI002467C820|nr:recombinase family protein [Rhodococcus zopfii]
MIARVLRERASGATLQAIADGLNADDVPTAQGGASWKPGTIAALLRRAAA